MKTILAPGNGLIFMKVGVHDGEAFDQILERKRREIEKEGMSFWGYGGNTCHPTMHVQPFSRMRIEEGKNIYLVMQEIKSNHKETGLVADEYSIDGLIWKKVPADIEVRGSRYAIVLDELAPGDLDFPLSNYQVAVGPSRGRIATDYIKGRVDKGCLIDTKSETKEESEQDIRKITQIGKVKNPFAVMLRGNRNS